MRILLFIILSLGQSFHFNLVSAQSAYPNCIGSYSNSWNNCKGIFKNSEFEYIGDFKNGSYDGNGKYTSFSGIQYNGAFKYGAFNGWGTYKFENGITLIGWWKDNLYYGKFHQNSDQSPSKNEFYMINSINASSAQSACLIENNPACFLILDTVLYSYRNGMIEHFRDSNSKLCDDDIPLESFRSAFVNFFPYQPGMHAATASEFLSIVLFEVWSCMRKNQRYKK